MKNIIINLIKLYQLIPGPWHNTCRHYPTCSEYTKQAVEIHGGINGSILGIKRIFKCNPWGSHGIDLVPQKKEK